MSTVTKRLRVRILICDGCGRECGSETSAEGVLYVMDKGVSPWDYDYPDDLGWRNDDPDLGAGDYCADCWEWCGWGGTGCADADCRADRHRVYGSAS